VTYTVYIGTYYTAWGTITQVFLTTYSNLETQNRIYWKSIWARGPRNCHRNSSQVNS